MILPGRTVAVAIALAVLSFGCRTQAWSSSSSPTTTECSRRDMLRVVTTSGVTTGMLVGWSTMPQRAMAAPSDTRSTLLLELKDSKSKLIPIPDLLQAQEWDKVRNILKTPPVNKLWNLGESQNTVMQLAKELGDPELFELKDELSYQLQICDQLTYDNVFVYFQPGSGKINIKGPIDAASNAMKYLDQIIQATE
jgi:hypothetical protein